jgi:TatA/E family protein of Tat protein translocase
MIPVFAILDTPIILAIVGVVVLLFGADRLPKLARSMGLAKKEFDTALHPTASAEPQPPAEPPPPPQPPPTPPQNPPPGQS